MSKKSPQKSGLYSKHHNVPRSRGGSDHDFNVQNVLKERHIGFHQWAENHTPCELVRLIALHSARLEDRCLDPSSMSRMISPNGRSWHQKYMNEAIKSILDVNAIRDAKAIGHQTLVKIRREQDDIKNLVAAIHRDRGTPKCETPFIQAALAFFETEDPREALQGLLEEKQCGEFAWVKPLREKVRSDYLKALKKARLITITLNNRTQIMDVLIKHGRSIRRRGREWKSELG